MKSQRLSPQNKKKCLKKIKTTVNDSHDIGIATFVEREAFCLVGTVYFDIVFTFFSQTKSLRVFSIIGVNSETKAKTNYYRSSDFPGTYISSNKLSKYISLNFMAWLQDFYYQINNKVTNRFFHQSHWCIRKFAFEVLQCNPRCINTMFEEYN